mgnify:CR=1 FL=1
MSSFILKIIAIISMSFDHVGYLIMGGSSWFNYIGRFAFPIFAFQISEGYLHTKDIYKYLFRLFIFAIISQIPFMLFQYSMGINLSLNVFFTLLFGLLAIFIYDKIKYKFLGILCAFILGLVAELCSFDYGFYGIAIIFIFYLFRNNKLAMCLNFIIAVLLKNLYRIYMYGFRVSYIYSSLFVIGALFFICLYNGKKGRNIKYLLYFFYPVHLFLIYLISLI